MTTKTDNIQKGPLVDKDQEQKHLKNAAKKAYSDQKQDGPGDEQIIKFMPMIHKIAQRVTTYVKPPLSYEDLISAGTVGLVKAANDFDPSHHAEFQTYAYIRIKGAILDELRGWSFVPANVSKQIRQTSRFIAEITEQTGVSPTDTELAEKLGISVEKLYQRFENARAQHFISIDNTEDAYPAMRNLLAAANTNTPADELEQHELIEMLAKAIEKLNTKHRHVILLYYYQQLTMKQIAEVLNITEPRVSQLHASALLNLSVKLRQWKDGG